MPSFGNLFASLTLESASFMSGIKAAQKELVQTQKTFQRVGGNMQKIGGMMTLAITAPLTAFGVSSFRAASDAEELQATFNSTFGAMSGSMNKWATETGNALGRSTQEMQKAANTFGMFFNQATDPAKAAEMSQIFSGLAQDLGSFFNVDTDTAIEKLRSGLSGESEPLRDFGVFLTEANVKAKGLAMGLGGLSGELTEQEKILARYQLIMEATTKAQGAATREADSAAGRIRAAKAAFDELQVIVGTKLLPVLTPLIDKIASVLTWFTELPAPVQTITVAFLGFATVLGPVVAGLGTLITAVGSALPVLAALRVAMMTQAIPAVIAFGAVLGPILLPIAAVTAAIAGVVLVVRNWDKIKPYVDMVVGWMGDLYRGVKSWVVDKLNAVWDTVRAGVDRVKGFFFGLYDAVVGHSYVPDMVDEIGQHMARLNETLVKPAQAATQTAAEAFQALQQKVAPILDRLFPSEARMNQLRADIALLEEYAKQGNLTATQLEEAKRRARLEAGGMSPEAQQTGGVTEDMGAISVDVVGLSKTVEGAWDRVKAANDNTVQSFADMARDIVGSLGNLGRSIKSGDWMGALQNVLDTIGQIAGLINGTGKPATRTFDTGLSLSGARAKGGPVLPYGDYLVGEKGPEILRMGGRRGTIVPNDQIGGAAVVQLVVGEGQMFEPRVAGISGNVSVETVRSSNRTAALRGRQRLA